MDELNPRQIESLCRVFERFVMEGNKHIKENFQNHQEAGTNPYLVSEYVADMAVVAQVYRVISPGRDVYAQAAMRDKGLAQAINPQTSKSPQPPDPGEEVDLLKALETNRRIIAQSSATERAGGLLSQADANDDTPAMG